MALSGIFYGATNNQFIKPRIEWTAVQSQEGNYSDVTATLTYSRTNTGFTTAGTWSGSITIGNGIKTDSKYLTLTYDSNTVAISHTVRVEHDAYGSAKVQISAAGSISETSLESTTIMQVVELDTIARETTIGASDGFIGSNVTISVKQRNQAYTHSIKWAFGALSGYIGMDWQGVANEVKLTDSSISFALPESFYKQITDKQEGICTLTCRTYWGDTKIGTDKSCTFRVMTRQQVCAPKVSGTVEDVNSKTLALTGNSKTMVRGFSTARCTITANPQKDASITQRKILGVSVGESSVRDIGAFAENQVTFRAEDSRGYFGEYVCPVDVIAYVKLSAVVMCQRTDPTSGKCILTVNGQYFNGSFGKEKNTLKVMCQVGTKTAVQLQPQISGNSYQLITELTELDYATSHQVTVTVSDRLMTIPQSVTVKKGIPVFDWGQNDFAFHVPVNVEGSLSATSLSATQFSLAGRGLLDCIYPIGAIYMSVEDVNPGATFGGSWTRLKDRFLLGAGTLYTAGNTGGSASHPLTVDELPSHSHGLYFRNEYVLGGAGNGVTNTAGGQSTATQTGVQYMESVGEGKRHNNMPPYLVVYMWKRVA